MRWLAVTASAVALTASTVVAGPVARADDDMAARIAAADSYLATRPGVVGYVLRDRKTGTMYRNAHAADPDQQRGVWGAGPAMAPGNKDGWSLEDGWVINTVGFAGKGQRYTLAVMNDLGGDGGYDDGVATTTHLSQLLLAGRDAG